MTKGKRIFLRFDENFEHQYAYVYLENKTFINAHLIKNKLMIVDESLEFRFKKRFLRYQKQNL
jgi:site-specific DNA-methyltransferase (adenine-specific)